LKLKCNAAGQSYLDAILPVRVDRKSETALSGLRRAAWSTCHGLGSGLYDHQMAGNAPSSCPSTWARRTGVNAGAGNPTYEDHYSVSYMWEDILTQDTVLD
jgi:type I restriction enzyme R subunit